MEVNWDFVDINCNVSFQKLHNLDTQKYEFDGKRWQDMVLQIEFFFHCKNLPGWSGRIQLTSAVLPLIMNEDVENVEE